MAKNVIITCYRDGKVAITTVVDPKLDIIRFMENLESLPVVHSCFETDIMNIKSMFPGGAINMDRLTHNNGTLVYDANRKNRQEIKDILVESAKAKLRSLGLTSDEVKALTN